MKRSGSSLNLDRLQRAPDDQSYLNEVAQLSYEGITWNFESISAVRDLLASWNHNIRLADGIYTSYCPDYYPAHQEIMKVVNEGVSGEFKGKRILDVGCLEGYFAAECALQGAEVLGIEGKLINVKKCEFVKSVLGIDNLQVVQDDALAVTQERYGSFDVVLALGLLYHLDDPFTFLGNMSNLCTGFAVIDSLIAFDEATESVGADWKPELSSLREFTYRDTTYVGRLYREFESHATQLEKDLSRMTSLQNELSVWLTEPSLVQLMRDVGFEQVEKLVYGRREDLWWADQRRDARVLFLARRHRNDFRSKIFGP